VAALPDDARRIWHAAVRGAAAHPLVERVDWQAVAPRPLTAYRRLVVVGAGKAAMAMAGAAEHALAPHLAPGTTIEGAVVVPHGYPAAFPADAPRPRRVRAREAGHPAPDAASAAAADEALALCAAAGDGDLVLALVSGGGSALWPAIADGLTLDDVRATVALLLRSGAGIAAVNAVRRHLSRVGGGPSPPPPVLPTCSRSCSRTWWATTRRWSRAGRPRPTPPPSPTRWPRCWAHELWDRVPNAVRAHLTEGVRGTSPTRSSRATRRSPGCAPWSWAASPTPSPPPSPRPRRSATPCGWSTAPRWARPATQAPRPRVRRRCATPRPPWRGARAGPACLLWGGETTVAVRGPGRGGRNQECALAAALALERAGPLPPGVEAVYLAAGTDGVDGPTDAAGGWVAPGAAAAVRAAGADPALALAANDSHAALAALGPPDHPLGAGGLVVTGPTHTNVMDVHLALVRPAAPRP
jgi:hydroxypyruvate reductase